MVDYDSALPIRTQLVDGDTVAATQDMMLFAGTDGSNYQAVAVDSAGNLQVDIVSGGVAPSKVDDSAFAIGTDTVSPLGALADDTASDSVDEGDIGLVRMGLNRVLYNQPFDGTNKQPMLDAVARAGFMQVTDGTNTMPTLDVNTRAGFVQITDGVDDLEIVVDGASAGTKGIHLLGTDGANAQILSTDSSGFLNVNTDSSPLANTLTYGSVTAVKDTPITVVSQAGVAIASAIQCSGSGLMKVEVKYGTTASETTTAVLYNSAANPNVVYEFPKGFAIASGSTMLLSVTNLEKVASTGSDFTAHGTIMLEA